MGDKFWEILGLVIMFTGVILIVVGVPLFYVADLFLNNQAVVRKAW